MDKQERIAKNKEEQARQLKRYCDYPNCINCIFLDKSPRLWGCRINSPNKWKV